MNSEKSGEAHSNLSRRLSSKQAAAKQLIERYYYQLTDGCGNANCENSFCASSNNFRRQNATRNELAILAIDLYKSKAHLCNGPSIALPDLPSSSLGSAAHVDASEDFKSCSENWDSSVMQMIGEQNIKYLNEAKLSSIIEDCRSYNNWNLLIRAVGEVFSSPSCLMLSFRMATPKKEEIRALEGDYKDEDEKVMVCDESEDTFASVNSDDEILNAVQVNPSATLSQSSSSGQSIFPCDYDLCGIDIDSLRRSYASLMSLPNLPFLNALSHALSTLSNTIEMDLKYKNVIADSKFRYVNIFVIVLELPLLHSPEFVETIYPQFCRAISHMNQDGQIQLVNILSRYERTHLQRLLESLQQLVTVRVISGEERWRNGVYMNDDESITAAVRLMKLVYLASLLGGTYDSPHLLQTEKDQSRSDESINKFFHGAMATTAKEPRAQRLDPLMSALDIIPINCRKPIIPHEEFVSDPLNDFLDIATDYAFSKAGKFSFIEHSFILMTASKNVSMYYDNRICMLNERRASVLQTIMHNTPSLPYLRIHVRRDQLIDDALIALEMVAMDNPQDLKKQMIVEFEGEQGLDEGGITKEFFQLIVEQMFNPDFGMFTFNEDTQQFWFNPTSFENDDQFMLIGILLGLAIYNNAILDVRFPFVVYRKLLGKLGVFEDLSGFDPVLAKGLLNMLQHDGDTETEFMQTFRVYYRDIFGIELSHDLKDDGDSIPVTTSNKREFVDLYADFLLNTSVAKQFRAFKHGFHMVTNESPLEILFRPDEIELLVCGSKKFDFNELEKTTEYDGGFVRLSPTVINFWEVVHDFSDEQKRKLLQFATGTDRVPVGGLAKLKLIIARNGGDSHRLPTAHTCFNVLLLPDYSSKEKLKDRLLKAITYSKGFGMF